MIAVDARKEGRRLRTYIGLGLVALIPIIFAIAFKANPPTGPQHTFFDLASSSGINMSIAALTGESAILLIVVVALFAGESLSGEAEWGTLRYLLVRPVTRNRLLGAKLTVAVSLAVFATFVVTIIGLAAGTLAFGWHPVKTPSLTTSSPFPVLVTVSQLSAVGRLAIATLFVAWCQSAFIAFAFMLSTMTDKAFGAVAGGVGLGVVSQILNNISALNGISYIFPTHYVDAWHELFFSPIHTGEMVRGIVLQVPYVVAFLGVAWWWFNRKDIVS